MYTAQNFKNDLLENITPSHGSNIAIRSALLESEFKFEDTSLFTRKVWDTFQRYLRIYCPKKFKQILDNNNKYILEMADKVHGERDTYYIMRVDIIATSSTLNNGVGPEFITINKSIKINKRTDYVGEGGCGSVYKLFDELLNQYVAYKIFDPSSFHQSDVDFLKKRFIREGKKLIGYRHKNIVAGYELGIIEEVPYIKMEYVEGKGLLQFIKEANPKDIVRINLAYTLISAIGYAHSKEDVHRDLSYSNIIVSDTGELKLLDFGFSKGDLDTSYDTTLCPVRTKFSPPEIASGAEYTFSSEVYCIGAIIYSIFTGNEFNIQNLHEINEIDIPVLYKNIILKCLDREPENRFAKASFIKFYIDKSRFIKQSGSLFVPEKNDDFSLDSFQEMVNENIHNIIFSEDFFPTLSTIQVWVSDGLRDYIGDNLYLTKGSFTDLIFKIDGVIHIIWYRGADKMISVPYLKELYSYFLNINEHQKDFFCKTFFSIIKRVAATEDLNRFDDAPF